MKLTEIQGRFFELVEKITEMFKKYDVDYDEDRLIKLLRKKHDEPMSGVEAAVKSLKGKDEEMVDDFIQDGIFTIDSPALDTIFQLSRMLDEDSDVSLPRWILSPFADTPKVFHHIPDLIKFWFGGKKFGLFLSQDELDPKRVDTHFEKFTSYGTPGSGITMLKERGGNTRLVQVADTLNVHVLYLSNPNDDRKLIELLVPEDQKAAVLSSKGLK